MKIIFNCRRCGEESVAILTAAPNDDNFFYTEVALAMEYLEDGADGICQRCDTEYRELKRFIVSDRKRRLDEFWGEEDK